MVDGQPEQPKMIKRERTHHLSCNDKCNHGGGTKPRQ